MIKTFCSVFSIRSSIILDLLPHCLYWLANVCVRARVWVQHASSLATPPACLPTVSLPGEKPSCPSASAGLQTAAAVPHMLRININKPAAADTEWQVWFIFCAGGGKARREAHNERRRIFYPRLGPTAGICRRRSLAPRRYLAGLHTGSQLCSCTGLELHRATGRRLHTCRDKWPQIVRHEDWEHHPLSCAFEKRVAFCSVFWAQGSSSNSSSRR